ncbi:MAG: TatD family hydrolase [Anaerolineae bacterium]
MIDTHVHLQDRRYAADLDAVLQRAAEAGVTAAVVPATNLEDCPVVVALTEDYADAPCRLYAAVGIHPTEAHDLERGWLERLRNLAQHPRVVAIGEVGLDYYWPRREKRGWPCASPACQREVFQYQLELAADLGLPVIVHDRDAHEDTLTMLISWLDGAADRGATLHAYAAGTAYLEQAMASGLYVGIDGPVTFKKATELHAVARRVHLDRLLLETDGPYLTPVPHRGKRNEPAYVSFVAERIAELRDVSIDLLDRATTHNAQTLFKGIV